MVNMKILRIDTTYWLLDYLNRATSMTNYVHISKGLVVNIRISLLNLR